MPHGIRTFPECMLGMTFARLFFRGLSALPVLALAGAFGLQGRRRGERSPPRDRGPAQDADDR